MNRANATKSVTGQRILEAAGEIFAERGYRGATVRAICDKANANIAAINYHFGGKKNLYVEVLDHAYQSAYRKYPPDAGLENAHLPVEERLRAFIRSYLMRIFDTERPQWHISLIAREMFEASPTFDDIVEREYRPSAERLLLFLSEVIGEEIEIERLQLYMWSVVSQCMIFYHSRELLKRLFPGTKYGIEDVDSLTDHIAKFSLAGLRGAK